MGKSTNYYNTFIEVSEDCFLEKAEIPIERASKETIATIQFYRIKENPYIYTSDEIIFHIYASKNEIGADDIEEEKTQFFSKGQPCLRCSPLPKRYGWGIHYNAEGRIAIYAIESDEYSKLKADTTLKHLKAMRSSRK
ncbi:hypothetical protein CLV62_12317 [Dysgonomonas alginatilytica]|uniref:Uncharacterized protein n=1 Tax=Dysgonomonas alginatilytica TaxID=1605892 RepID=A0A2V3PMA9_9BACT|nr:DUF6157 family protein [Dysgonomonas alginatilytica]PXV61974.1 hypothetical protein CLV62_12317 [Dysgonomonas alginatilytica]